MAFSMSVQIHFLSLWLALFSMDDSGSGAQEFQLRQPQDAVSVAAGETLTLNCTVSGDVPVGPVKWFKDSGSGRQLIYEDKEADKGSFHRVTRALPGSNTDFTIRIPNTCPEDAGTYRCVKFQKGSGADEKISSGPGTNVSVSDSHSVPPDRPPNVTAAVATTCVLLVILLLVAVYVYWRKKRGRSLCPARPQAPSPDDLSTLHQPSDEKDPDILYADLHHSRGPQKPKESVPEERSEYAAIKVTQPSAK